MDSVTASEKRLKRQVIGKPHRFLAIAPLGFEQTLADELTSICLGNAGRHPEQQSSEGSSPESISFHVIGDGKVEFTAKITDAWKAVAYTRVANRILMHIADFKAENFRDLEKKAAEIPWELYFFDDRRKTIDERGQTTLHIHVTCKHSRLYHSDAIAERLYQVIDACPTPSSSWTRSVRDPYGSDPHLSKEAAPKQNLYVTLIDDRCTLWLDLAGEELYKRGHERFVNDAPLKETIAAAMLFEAISTLRIIHHQSSIINYPLSITLIDPMAGSGTFSLEAAYMASGFIPGKCRDFALKHQPAFKPATWNHIVKQESVILSETPNGVESKNLFANILTSDISERAIGIIRHNVECSPLAQSRPEKNSATGAPSSPATNKSTSITPRLRDFFTYTAKEIADACHAPSASNAPDINDSEPVIVLNPPYGKRLDFDAPKLYTKIGKKLAELALELAPFGMHITVAILAPKDDSRPGSKFTCTTNLLHECKALDPAKNASAKLIETSHGGLGLNVFIARI